MLWSNPYCVCYIPTPCWLNFHSLPDAETHGKFNPCVLQGPYQFQRRSMDYCSILMVDGEILFLSDFSMVARSNHQILLSHGELLLFCWSSHSQISRFLLKFPIFHGWNPPLLEVVVVFVVQLPPFTVDLGPLLNPRPRRRPRSGARPPGAALHRRGRWWWPSSCARFCSKPIKGI